MGLGKDGDPGQPFFDGAGERIKGADIFDFLIEEFDANRQLVGFGREDVDHVTADPVGAALEINVVTRVLEFGELPQNAALVDDLASRKMHDHLKVRLWVTKAINR